MDHSGMCLISHARTYIPFCSCDLAMEPMTLTYKHDLDMSKMYPRTQNEVSRSMFQKSEYKQTDT